jgi:hypothetical protein
MRPTIASVSSFVLLPALSTVLGQQQLTRTSSGELLPLTYNPNNKRLTADLILIACTDDCIALHLVSVQAHSFESLCDTPSLQASTPYVGHYKSNVGSHMIIPESYPMLQLAMSCRPV